MYMMAWNMPRSHQRPTPYHHPPPPPHTHTSNHPFVNTALYCRNISNSTPMLYVDIAMSLGYHKVMTRSFKGHGKVKSTENSWKYLVFAAFLQLCSLWMIRSSQGHSNVKLSIKRVIIACFCCFCYNYVHIRLRKNLGLTPLWSPNPTRVIMIKMSSLK